MLKERAAKDPSALDASDKQQLERLAATLAGADVRWGSPGRCLGSWLMICLVACMAYLVAGWLHCVLYACCAWLAPCASTWLACSAGCVDMPCGRSWCSRVLSQLVHVSCHRHTPGGWWQLLR